MKMLSMKNLRAIDDPVLVRRSRLRQWIDEHFGGEQVRFIADCASREYHINQGELSGLLKQKSFGEKKARALEVGGAMPFRYLDTRPGDQPEHEKVIAMEEAARYTIKGRDKWIREAIDILDTLTTEQRIACVVNLRAYKAAIGPARSAKPYKWPEKRGRA